MKRCILLLFILYYQDILSQDHSEIYFNEAKPSDLYCEADEENNVLTITKTINEGVYNCYLITNKDSIKEITKVPIKVNEKEFSLDGVSQDDNNFFVFFKYRSDGKTIADILVIKKKDQAIKWIRFVDIIQNTKERMLESFVLKDKYYTLIMNKKTDELIFHQFKPEENSVVKRSISLKTEEVAFRLLNEPYFISELDKDNSVYEAWCTNKIFERENNKILITSEKIENEKFKGNTYFFEFDFNKGTAMQRNLMSEKINIVSTGYFWGNINSSNSFVYEDKFYKTWLRDGSLLIRTYDLESLSIIEEKSFTKKNITYNMIEQWKQSGIRKKDSTKLTDGEYIMRGLGKGNSIICLNGNKNNKTMQIGARVILRSSGGGGGSFGSGVSTISTPNGPVTISSGGGFQSHWRYSATAGPINYLNIRIDSTDSEPYLSVFEKIQHFVGNRDDDFKRLEKYPNSIYKSGNNYILSFIYKKKFYRYIF